MITVSKISNNLNTINALGLDFSTNVTLMAIFMSVFLTYFLLVGKKGGMVFMFDF